MNGVIFSAPNQIAGIQIITPRRVPKQEIMKVSNCYVGMRDKAEIDACLEQGVFDLVIWVDASNRLPKESKDSFNIKTGSADILISNNRDLATFEEKAKRLGDTIFNG